MTNPDASKPPARLDGKELEQECIKYVEGCREIDMNRYGTQSAKVAGVTVELKSLPDFEGVTLGGSQFIFDAKVESGASFGLGQYLKPDDARNYTNKARQLNHMFKRSAFGVACFLLIHWNERKLKTKSEPARTVAFPIHPQMNFWERFRAGEEKSINRKHCNDYGVDVRWEVPNGKRALRIQLLPAIQKLRVMKDVDSGYLGVV